MCVFERANRRSRLGLKSYSPANSVSRLTGPTRINTAAPNERDIGFFLYYTPTETRKLFRSLIDKGLKGSGDYGVLGIGVYNGQSAECLGSQ